MTPIEPAELTDLDHLLTARWALYSAPLSGLHLARAHHQPWPLHRAQLTHLHDELVVAAGLPEPEGTPLVHYSPVRGGAHRLAPSGAPSTALGAHGNRVIGRSYCERSLRRFCAIATYSGFSSRPMKSRPSALAT